MLKLQNGNFERLVLILYGFLGTMPIISIKGLTIFTWMTFIIVLYIFMQTLYSKNYLVNKKTITFLTISFFVLLSSFICLTSEMHQMWKEIQYKNMIWQILHVFIFVFYYRYENYRKVKYYLKGIYYASLFQVIWSFLQYIVYSLFTISINKLIFYDIFKIPEAAHIQTKGSSIALTGLCWNVGNMAPLIVFGYLFTKSPIIKLIFVLYSVLSGSRTLLLGMVLCVVLDIIIYLFKYRKVTIYKKHIKYFVVGVGFLVPIILLKSDIILKVLKKGYELIGSLSVQYLTTQSSARIHARYWTTIPQVTNWSKPINVLFGYGIGCSGYPFAMLYNQYADHSWVVECDFINILWNYGYIGFILFYSWYIHNIIKGYKIDKKYIVLLITLLAEGVMYNVMFNWCYIAILFIFICISYKENIFELIYDKGL